MAGTKALGVSAGEEFLDVAGMEDDALDSKKTFDPDDDVLPVVAQALIPNTRKAVAKSLISVFIFPVVVKTE